VNNNEKDITNELHEYEFRKRVANDNILTAEVSILLLKLVGETIDGRYSGKLPNTKQHARKIVSYIREHLK